MDCRLYTLLSVIICLDTLASWHSEKIELTSAYAV
jgi:hypothetical protein